jgi:hypothetical protein
MDRRKRKCYRYNRRIFTIVDEEIKTLKVFTNLNYKVIAIRSNRGYQPRVEKMPTNKQSYSWCTRVRLVGENIEPGVLNFQKLYVYGSI